MSIFGLCVVFAITAIISAKEPPSIQPFLMPKKLMSGGRAKLMCSAVSGDPPLSFKWLKNNIELENDIADLTIENHAEYSSLTLYQLSQSSNGNYTCVISNEAGSDRHIGQLLVNAPPTFVTMLEDKTVAEGSNLTFECGAMGSPVPKIEWKVKIGEMEKIIEDNKKLNNVAVLYLNNISKIDQGIYVCTASNIWQSVSQTINVKVTVPARFEEKFSIETVRRGDSASLKCKAKGDEPLTITWSKDKQDIGKDSRYERFENSEKDGISSELFVRNVERSDGALYHCLAKNNYGTDERNIKVVVVEVPSQILDARVQETWSRSVSIFWSSPYSGNSPITKFIIQYWRDKEAPHKLHEQEVTASQTTAVISKNLQPGVSYALTLIAENEVGQGEPSKEIQFVTGEEEPSGPPTDVWAEAKGSTSIEVQWKAPPKEHWNGELKGYYIGYKLDRTTHTYSYKTVEDNANDTMRYVLNDLLKSMRYSIVVKAYNGAGTGPASQDLLVKTLEGELPNPPAVTVLSASTSSISVKWGHIGRANDKVTGYTIHLQKDTGEWTHIPMIVSEQNRYTLTGLDSGTPYRVFVTANNQFGRGNPSETLTVKTVDMGMQMKLPFDVDLGLIIPVAAGTIAIFVVIIVIIIYVRKAKARRDFEKSLHHAMQANKDPTYMGTTQRYIDIDKARPMMPPPPGLEPGTPGSSYAAYATIPSRDTTLDSRYGARHEMKTFLEERNEKPPTYPRPNSMKKQGPYDSIQ